MPEPPSVAERYLRLGLELGRLGGAHFGPAELAAAGRAFCNVSVGAVVSGG